jgi:hypothetical protein
MRRMTLEDFETVMDIHLKGIWLGARIAATVIREQVGGATSLLVHSPWGCACWWVGVLGRWQPVPSSVIRGGACYPCRPIRLLGWGGCAWSQEKSVRRAEA